MARSRFRPFVVGSVVVCTAATVMARDVELTNPSFEMEKADGTPVGWNGLGSEGYQIEVDGDLARDGERSVRIERTGIGADFGGLVQTVDPSPFHGHGLVLSGWIRTRGVSGRGALWARVDAGSRMLGLENMDDRGPSGDTQWTRFEARLPVPSNATRILLGVLQSGAGTSWYDDLELRVDSTVSVEPADVPELEPPDTTLVAADPAAVRSVRATGRPLRSLTATDDFSDLTFLDDVIGDRRVVQLGESAHGVKQFSQVKVRLIRYLHEALGFDVIALESSLFECWNGWRHADSLSAEGLMEHCIFGVWRSDETLALFEYIEETRESGRPLILAGFDTQPSSSATTERLDFWTEVLTPLDAERARSARSLDSTFVDIRRDPEALASRAEELVAAFTELAGWIEDREEALRELHPDEPDMVGIARRLATSTVHVIRQHSLGAGPERTLARDEGMADNLLFLMDELYPERRIITWGHNVHLRHANSKVTANAVRTMGEWVAEARRDDLYTVGLYMRRGRAAFNNREIYNVRPPLTGSLEAILANAARELETNAIFVDLATAGAAEGGDWIRSEVPTRSWGTAEVGLVPIQQYDAVLLIDEVSPPDYR